MITDYGVKGLIYKALAETPMSDRLATLARRVDSTLPAGSAEKLDFLGMVPALRRWVGSREAKRVLAYAYTVITDKYESTIDIPLDWINNDKTGQVAQAAGQLVRRYNPQWISARVAYLLNNAASLLCFDGKAFFATDHSWGDSGTIDNKIVYNGSSANNPTAIEAASAIVAAYNAMMAFKDDRGEPTNENMSKAVLLVPAGVATTIASAVYQAVKQDRLDTGAGVLDNPVKGLPCAFEVVSTPRYTQSRMLMINDSPDACPLAFIENKADFSLTSKANGSDYAHDSDAWQYGIKAVGEAGFGRFTDAISTEFT
jgi:phage major head subunit gpT-like protein